MQQKKLLGKTFRKYALFSILLVFVVLLITFFVHFLTTFSTDSKSARNSAFFDSFLIKKRLGHICTFSNFEAKRAKNGSKNQKNLFSKFVLDFNFAPIKGSVSSFSLKKSQIRCTLMDRHTRHRLIKYLGPETSAIYLSRHLTET